MIEPERIPGVRGLAKFLGHFGLQPVRKDLLDLASLIENLRERFETLFRKAVERLVFSIGFETNFLGYFVADCNVHPAQSKLAELRAFE